MRSTPTTAAQELAPGVYGIGFPIELDGRVSWYPRTWSGYASANCYVIVDDEAAFLIDTGLPIHRQAVIDEVRRIVGNLPVTILHTRSSEIDNGCNVEPLREAVDVVRMLAGESPADYVYFLQDPFVPNRPATTDRVEWRGVDHVRLREVTSMSLDGAESPEGRLQLIKPLMRILPVFWVFDRASGVLFTSDAFGSVTSEEPCAMTTSDARWAPRRAAEHLYTKFAWMAHADRSEIAADLRRIFDDCHVTTIAPGYGGVISGRDAVLRHVDAVHDALQAGPPADLVLGGPAIWNGAEVRNV